MTEQGHIFISYARQDGRDYAARLDADLQKAGFETWWDTRNIDPNQDFSTEIETGIQKASHVAVCVTPSIDANPSSFVRRELIYAESKGKPIIPLVFPDAIVPVLVNHLTWIPFANGKKPRQKLAYEKGFEQLIERLKAIPKATAPRITDDPYREYLTTLYDQIVRYLNLTVFSLITLRGEATPDAVERKQVLPMAFWSMAGVEDKATNNQKQFNNFYEAFEQYDGRVLLLGEPGAGKTTTLFAFARDMVAKRLENPTLPLPILAPIATWDAPKQTLLPEWLAEQVSMLKKNEVENLIENGKVLLLLDGLDELGSEREETLDPNPTPSGRGKKYDPRLRFLQVIPPNTQTVVTCRLKDYGEIGEKAKLKGAVTLNPLNDEQMQAYLHELPDLWEALKGDDLRDVARTPLLLSLFTFAFKELPEEAKALRDLKRGALRDKIFDTYIRRRYEWEKQKLYTDIGFSLDEIYPILGQLAMDNASVVVSTKNAIYQVDFARLMPRKQVIVFAELMSRLHILRIDNGLLDVNSTFHFIHLLLRDYFAYNFALSCLASKNPVTRWRAVDTLGKLKDMRATEYLIAALEDVDDEVRELVAYSLGELGDDRAINTLVDLLNDPDIEVCIGAAQSLGELKALIAVEHLIRLLDNDSGDGYLRVVISETLAKIGNEIAVKPLINLLDDTRTTRLMTRVCDEVGTALLQLGTPEAVKAVVKHNMHDMFHSPDELYSQMAADSLISIGTPEALAAVEEWRKQQGKAPE